MSRICLHVLIVDDANFIFLFKESKLTCSLYRLRYKHLVYGLNGHEILSHEMSPFSSLHKTSIDVAKTLLCKFYVNGQRATEPCKLNASPEVKYPRRQRSSHSRDRMARQWSGTAFGDTLNMDVSEFITSCPVIVYILFAPLIFSTCPKSSSTSSNGCVVRRFSNTRHCSNKK